MRHTVTTLLACLLAAAPLAARAELSVFACEPEWQALAEEIGGHKVTSWSATSAAQDPHHVQARPSLIARLRTADLLVCSGADLEAGWLPVLLRRARNPRLQPGQPGHLMAAEQVSRLETPDRLDRSQGDVHALGNPHVQLDPRRLLEVATRLAERLAEIDSTNAGYYQARLADFRQRWQSAMAHWSARAAGLRGGSVVVHHSEWIYLLDWLGMERSATLEPKPGLPPTAGHLAELKARLRAAPALAIIRSPGDDPRPAEWLAGQTGIPVVILPRTVDAEHAAGDLFALFDTLVTRLGAAAARP